MDRIGSTKQFVPAGLLAAISVLVVSLSASYSGGGAGPGGAAVMPVGSNPRGQSYAQWAADWLTWAAGVPAAHSPFLDATGADLGTDQTKRVWFLAGNFGGADVRNATVPAGTSLFFPVINEFWIITPGDPAWDEPYLDPFTLILYDTFQDYVIEQVLDPAVGSATHVFCTVDGKAVNNITGYRVLSEEQDATVLPDGNVFGVPGGVYGANQSEGYYLMLPPLSAGKHTIHFGGQTNGFGLNVTYNLTVKGGK
jgi:hypothetical protein